MKTIAKKIIGMIQVVLVGFLGYGVCSAEEPLFLGEAIPISPFGAVDTVTPTFEWTSVPEATSYCLLIEDIDSVPVYLAWYTDEEAGCTAAETEVCAVTPSHIVYGDMWSVLPCLEEDCGQWSNPVPFGVVDTAVDPSGNRLSLPDEQARTATKPPTTDREPGCDCDINKFKACRGQCEKRHGITTSCSTPTCLIVRMNCGNECSKYHPMRCSMIMPLCLKKCYTEVTNVCDGQCKPICREVYFKPGKSQPGGSHIFCHADHACLLECFKQRSVPCRTVNCAPSKVCPK